MKRISYAISLLQKITLVPIGNPIGAVFPNRHLLGSIDDFRSLVLVVKLKPLRRTRDEKKWLNASLESSRCIEQ